MAGSQKKRTFAARSVNDGKGPFMLNSPESESSMESEIASASSSSTPKYLTVLSILVWPNINRTARQLPVFL